ncbi:MAG: photosynthetic complex assembly protein PuhC [Ancylobacter novellus]|uniref:Photosynthetic complex assembly protein PuhC n=1 Tax=Ancylobacter novellus TaxID=921 RepID=A0A2W5KG48_ANCNO|nr:MAG: photosynthetic complex assembly protein PuhC [Ancylobacter novellus]
MATVPADDFSPPRGFLIGAGVLAAAALAAAFAGGAANVGAFRMEESPTVESRLLTILDAGVGKARVIDAETGRLLRVTEPGVEDGFVWGALNGLSYGRKQLGAPVDAPYELARREDGRLTLTDLMTGQKVFLDSFGYGNAGAFARLLEQKEGAR